KSKGRRHPRYRKSRRRLNDGGYSFPPYATGNIHRSRPFTPARSVPGNVGSSLNILLEPMLRRLAACNNFDLASTTVLSDTMALLGAVLGNIQLYDPATRTLSIALHRGFKDEFLRTFQRVS